MFLVCFQVLIEWRNSLVNHCEFNPKYLRGIFCSGTKTLGSSTCLQCTVWSSRTSVNTSLASTGRINGRKYESWPPCDKASSAGIRCTMTSWSRSWQRPPVRWVDYLSFVFSLLSVLLKRCREARFIILWEWEKTTKLS